jgi:hypothetical protein
VRPLLGPSSIAAFFLPNVSFSAAPAAIDKDLATQVHITDVGIAKEILTSSTPTSIYPNVKAATRVTDLGIQGRYYVGESGFRLFGY